MQRAAGDEERFAHYRNREEGAAEWAGGLQYGADRSVLRHGPQRERFAAVRATIEGAAPQPGWRRWTSLILRDIQFWIPIAVLIGGLLALRWVS